jgi:hypothetical protein
MISCCEQKKSKIDLKSQMVKSQIIANRVGKNHMRNSSNHDANKLILEGSKGIPKNNTNPELQKLI